MKQGNADIQSAGDVLHTPNQKGTIKLANAERPRPSEILFLLCMQQARASPT